MAYRGNSQAQVYVYGNAVRQAEPSSGESAEGASERDKTGEAVR